MLTTFPYPHALVVPHHRGPLGAKMGPFGLKTVVSTSRKVPSERWTRPLGPNNPMMSPFWALLDPRRAQETPRRVGPRGLNLSSSCALRGPLGAKMGTGWAHLVSEWAHRRPKWSHSPPRIPNKCNSIALCPGSPPPPPHAHLGLSPRIFLRTSVTVLTPLP